MSATRKSIARVKLAELKGQKESEDSIWNSNLDVVKDVQVKIKVCLGEAELSVAELMALRQNSVVALNRDASHTVDLVLDGNVIGRGNLVVVGDNFGVELTEISNS
jgi:flagellar motor switch protein FliN/FliY